MLVDKVTEYNNEWKIEFASVVDIRRIFINDCFIDGNSMQKKWKITSISRDGDYITVKDSEGNNCVPSVNNLKAKISQY